MKDWPSSEKLSKEFESVGFYLSNHPLENFKDALDQYGTKTFKEFENSNVLDSFVAGTIMSIKEKKTSKGKCKWTHKIHTCGLCYKSSAPNK